jgi:murein DD-endopeptidase MepM/ murein hydrolase activator NlpD
MAILDVHSYPDYGASVLAVADGQVVDTLSALTDQTRGRLPDPSTITLENVDGNHVVLDSGGGVFAFYAHLQKGSVTVAPGDAVKCGQILGKLGNSGNTSAPHLHFHLMDGPSVLGSSGLPYVIDAFLYAGQVPAPEFRKASGVAGTWTGGLLTRPSPRQGQFPLDLAVVTFPSAQPARATPPQGAGAR